jgi:hypothetical protein
MIAVADEMFRARDAPIFKVLCHRMHLNTATNGSFLETLVANLCVSESMLISSFGNIALSQSGCKGT